MTIELRNRIITALIGVAILLLVLIYLGHFGAAFVSVVVALAMTSEFCTIFLELPDAKEKRQVLLGLTWLVALINFWQPRSEFELFLLCFMGVFIYYLATARRHEGPAFRQHFDELMASIFGLIYLGFLPLFLPLIRETADGSGHDIGLRWVIAFLLMVWATDIGGYFVGKRYGKTKLYEQVSPKKTREGVYGGVVGAILVTLLFKFLFFQSLPLWQAIVIPSFVSVVSVVGDLCESFLKRAFNKKDAGSVLPGHGGFLDRFDGVVFALPVMYTCIRLFS